MSNVYVEAKQGSSFPLAIAVVGMLAVLVYGGYRAVAAAQDDLSWVMLAIVVSYALWIASELRITAAEVHRSTDTDQGTCERYAIARAITMLAALGFAPFWTDINMWVWAGCGLFFAGMLLRGFAIYTLGKNYSHRVRHPREKPIASETQREPSYDIISRGPYRWVRHPAYSGMLLAHVGIALVFFNGFVVVALCGIFLPALVQRIRVEESHLLAIPAYRTFAEGRARLVPGVW